MDSAHPRPATARDYQERILRVLVFIQSHLDDAVSLDDLAALSHFSPFHFHRVFRGMVGESVMEHVRRLRLERSALRLKTSDEQVVHLAFEAGYETHEAFTRAFHAMFGMSPSDYRRQNRPPAPAAAPSNVHYTPDHPLNQFQPVRPGDSAMDVRLETFSPQHIAFVRHVGPYEQVGQTWSKLMSWAGPRGLLGPQTRPFGLSYDDPAVTPPDKVRYDACINVGPAARAEGEVGVRDLPGGEYAVAVHRGSYDRLNETYAMLYGQWLPASGRRPADPPSIERYLNDPRMTPPEQLLTEVCIPLA